MKKYDENNVVLMPGEHAIFLKKGTTMIGYRSVADNSEELIDNPNIIIPSVMLDSSEYLNINNYDLYINYLNIILPKDKIKQNVPGLPKVIYENCLDDEVILAPHIHNLRLPYREAMKDIDPESPTYGQMEEMIYHYTGYEATSKESDYEYPYGRSLWSDGDEPYITYKLYTNNVEVAILAKDLGKNIPGRPLVKKIK